MLEELRDLGKIFAEFAAKYSAEQTQDSCSGKPVSPENAVNQISDPAPQVPKENPKKTDSAE